MCQMLGFLKHIHAVETINLKFFRSFKDLVKQIYNCLEFMRRLFKYHMFFLALNIYFKAGLSQIINRLNFRPLIVIHTNH